jgi:diguanylate cyclase (GGDEF)-like protein
MVDISDRKQAEDELVHRTLHDPLTGLPNRVCFHESVEAAIADAEDSGSLAVLLIDLDRFKDVNDTLGHRFGDLLLCEFAAALRASLREPDLIARLGGDEFAILLQVAGGTAAGAASSAVERIAGLLVEPYIVEGVPLSVEASIGIAYYPDDGVDVDQLLQHADIAMYEAKGSGCGYSFYEPRLDGDGRERLQLLAELRRAISEKELVLHYQPKLDLRTGSIERVEALIRWQHPTRGLVSPAEFIPLAEQTGLIHPLTDYVLQSALRQCRRWLDDGLDLSVAVNVSARSLHDGRLPDAVAEQLRRHDVPPGNLVLELTEGAIIFDPARAEATLNALHRLGVRLALDDFGTGHSSLAFLGRLPLDQIKIDRSFVTDLASNPENDVIVRSIINLGHELGLEVVGEGVETREVRVRLQRYGCDLLQGFDLTPALPVAELEYWLQHRAPSHLTAVS